MRPASERLAAAERRLFARYGLDVSERFIDLAGPAMRLRVLEAGSGPPVLFLHGASLTAGHWAPLVAELPEFRCLAVDLPGHGRSDPVDFRAAPLRPWCSAMLASLLDGLGIEAAPVVGHSAGGLLALWLALDAPERALALVLTGVPAVALPGTRADALLTVLAIPWLNRLALGTPTPPALYRALLARSTGRHALAACAPEVAETSRLAARLPGVARSVGSLFEAMQRGSRPRPANVLTAAELRAIRQPALFIWGDHERFCPLERARESIGLVPDARLEVVPGGHEAWLDDPAGCGRLVSAFLGAQRGPT